MPKKILLADDSITIQKVVELTFSDGDYEVTAVNNGAKAIQKLAEMRPDIILSDIIMPEKNGYEVCEYVKSHPDFRNIPVVLLTGTFEPFDPDRAEKAGCDAVVTKPFESQSLIHKVEELIASAASAPAAAPEPEPEAPSPWVDDTPAASAFSSAGAPEPFTHDSDIFGAPPTPAATTEMPFELPQSTPFASPDPDQFTGETRAFPRMNFDDFQTAAPQPEPPPPPPAPAPEPSPWDEPADAFGGETRAFGKMSFDDFQTPAPAPAPTAAPEPEPESPFGAPPPADEFSGETRAFPRMNFDELNQMASNSLAPTPDPEPETSAPAASAWDEPAASPFAEEEAPAFGGETRAFPKLSFDDLQQMSASTPPPATEQEPAPWGEPAADEPAFGGGETRAFPKLSFDDFQSPAVEAAQRDAEQDAASQPAPWSEPSGTAFEAEAASPFAAPAPEPEPEPEPVESLWSPTADTSAIDTPATSESFSTAAAVPFDDSEAFGATPSPFTSEALPEDLPFAAETTPEPEPLPVSEPSWSPIAAAEAAAEPDEPVVPPPALAPAAPPMEIAARSSDLSDEQIDRIARRVVELMSDQVVRNIAWEVIPDLAEMVVKERIRQLEAEA
jgi:CheY-like chemotaxis protein